jgi:hypothetical protein
MRPTLPILRAAAVLTFALLATGCCSFERQWHDLRTCGLACPGSQTGPEGLWEGEWESCVNGHHGKLRAIVVRCDDATYEARFHATFLGCIPYESTVRLAASPTAGGSSFQGQADLGWLAGGLYTYRGWTDACRFESSYCCEQDHGFFHMTRVTGCGCGGCGTCAPGACGASGAPTACGTTCGPAPCAAGPRDTYADPVPAPQATATEE